MSDGPTSLDNDAAIAALLNAPSFDAVREVMHDNPILLSDDVIKALVTGVNDAGGRGDHYTRVWLLMNAHILMTCSEPGVDDGLAVWEENMRGQVTTALEWIQYYAAGHESELNQTLEEALCVLMAARRSGPFSGYWQPFADMIAGLIDQWIDKHDGGAVARAMLIRLLREHVEHSDAGTEEWAERMMRFAHACVQWFEWNGDQDALDSGIDLARQAIDARPDADWISGLGRFLLFRVEVKPSQVGDDLEQAIQLQRSALELLARDDRALRAVVLDRLGMSLRTSYERTGVIDELNEAVKAHEAAVRIAPTERPEQLGNCAAALLMRFVVTGDEERRQRAEQLLRREVALCPVGHALRADALANLATCIINVPEPTPESSAEAIGSLREAVDLAGKRQVRWYWELSLGHALLDASARARDATQRNEAERRLRSVLANTDPDWPKRASALALLGELEADARSDTAATTLAEAVDVGLQIEPDAALRAAERWRTWAIATNRIDSLKQASARSLDVLDALSERQASVQDQLVRRRRARAAVEDAAYALANAGEADLAVVHLERGRASVLRQSLPQAASVQGPASLEESPRLAAPAVYLIAARGGGCALVPGDDGIRALPLPDLTFGRVFDAVIRLQTAEEKRTRAGGTSVWRGELGAVTRWMHDAVVEPLADSLRELGPDVPFLVDGLGGLLPWAAAWSPTSTDPTGRTHLIDLPVNLSVAPTAEVLARAVSLARSTTLERTLIVAPSGDEAKTPQHVDAEVAAIAAARPGAVVMRTGVTAAAVMAAMYEADVVHFCCHGRSDLLNPLESYLVLDKGEHLRVADLLDGRARPRRLAVLSACETGEAGVAAPTEAMGFPVALLGLGFAGVVGSLWPVRSDATALLMARFHQLASDHAPVTALAEAQRWLRRLPAAEAGSILGREAVGDFSHIEGWAAFTFTGT